MKIFKFFITKIFLRKAMITLSVLLLLFWANYLVFIAARSNLSTLQGYKEMKRIDQEGNFIANLDPDSDMNMGAFEKNDTQNVYDYLTNNFNYALFKDGFIVSLPNDYDMEVSLGYLNEEYYKLNQFEISQGKNLDFNYHFDNDTEIPVLIGKGLCKTYPLGSTIRIDDPVLQKPIWIVNIKLDNFFKVNEPILVRS